MKLATKIGLIGVSVVLSVTAVGVKSAQAAGFMGSYAVQNWSLTNTNADGSVNTTNTPAQVRITGGNNGTGNPGTTDYLITASSNVSIGFSWNYSTQDFSSSNDPFQFIVNNVPTDIYNTTLDTGSGTFSTLVNQNNTFGFRIQTTDNLGGAGSVIISNFTATPIPGDFSPLPCAVLGVTLFTGRILKKRKASKQVQFKETTKV